MKVRTRQMPNGKWIVEGCGLTTLFRWHGIGFWEADSQHSIYRGTRTKGLCTYEPGNIHYATVWHETFRKAIDSEREAKSILGFEWDDV